MILFHLNLLDTDILDQLNINFGEIRCLLMFEEHELFLFTCLIMINSFMDEAVQFLNYREKKKT